MFNPKPFIFFCLVISFAARPLYAEVFLLGTARRGRPHNSELPGLRPQPLFSERVIVNGKSMDLDVFQMQATLEQTALILKNRFSPLKMAVGKNFARAVFDAGKNKTLRYLFVSAGSNQPLTVFQLQLPGDLPQAVWNSKLPSLPAGSAPDIVLEMPDRNAVYGAFTSCGISPDQLLSTYTARLKSNSWQSAGAEAGANIRGSGDLFIRNHPQREILLVQFGQKGDGAFYHKIIRP